MNTNINHRTYINPNFGFNRLSVENPFNYYGDINTYAPAKYNTITHKTPKPQLYNSYLLEENKLGLKTNPMALPMTNSFNLNTLNIRSEQKFNPYYNPNNYPQRVDNIKDLMNYTYSERVPRFSAKTNSVISNFTPFNMNKDSEMINERLSSGNNINIPKSSRIPETNKNLYNNFINDYQNDNDQLKNINNLNEDTNQKAQQINNAFLSADIQLGNNNNIQEDNNLGNSISNKNNSEAKLEGFTIQNGEIISDSNAKQFHRISNGGLVKSYAYFEDSNHENRDYMEDKGKSIENLNGDPNKILFCLFDGHGGGDVSEFLQQNFHLYMKKMLPFNNHFAEITKLFRVLDGEIKSLNVPNTGSTATIIYIEKREGKKVLYCANVGDTRCILINRKGIMRLSYDDRVEDPKEQERIIKQGGVIHNNRVIGCLMLSRSFGDWRIKKYGVIVEPHIMKIDLNDDDLYLILASDGVWDFIKDEECKGLIETNSNTLEICRNIVVEALSKYSDDNISCFVIKL